MLGHVRFAALSSLALLTACEQENAYVPSPPPKVVVAHPVQKRVTPYLEATGNTAAVNEAKLVARVSGFVQEIKYQDGAFVKQGTPLFVIEPEPYKLKLEQAQAAELGGKAKLTEAQAEYTRQAELQAKQVSTQALLDRALAARDSARANLQQAQVNTQQARVDYAYTHVLAPFDGIVTRRLISIGEYVGGTTPTELATIVQLEPLYVYFNISERDVLRIRADLARRGLRPADLVGKVPVEIGLQTETGYPHQGVIDYAAPAVDQSTGTLQLRGAFKNTDHVLLPGYYVRVRLPLQPITALLVPEAAIGSDQTGRYVLVVNAENAVEQRKVELGQTFDDMRAVESGLKPDDRIIVAGLLHAVPGQKVDPQLRGDGPTSATKASN